MRQRGSGHTLIEMLVVMAVIALLLSIVAPTLTTLRVNLRQTVCTNNEVKIGEAFKVYLATHDGRPPNPPNYGWWERPLGTKLGPGDPYAYWGIAYAPYLGEKREYFNCPSMQATDCDPGFSDYPAQPWVSYGLNRHVVDVISWSQQARPLTAVKKPSETILFHDAYEHVLEGSIDTLSAWGGPLNLTQWRNCTRSNCKSTNKNHEVEYYRHSGTCNVMWYDDHISAIPESDGTDIPKEYYTGE